MLSPLPRRSDWAYRFAHSSQPCQPSPKGSSGRPAHRPFRGLLGVHSRYGLHTRAVTVSRDTLSEGFSHFVTSIAAPAASGWSVRRVGFAPTGKRHLVTAHTLNRHQRANFIVLHNSPGGSVHTQQRQIEQARRLVCHGNANHPIRTASFVAKRPAHVELQPPDFRL